MRAIIAGGGIGGMAAAIALRQAGVEATVYERAPELREVGAGLSLWPNAVRVLDRLGLGAKLRAIGGPLLGGGIRASDGRVLVGSSDTELAARFRAPTLVVHRAEQLDALGEHLGWQHVQTGAELREFAQDAHGVTATFANGRTARRTSSMSCGEILGRARPSPKHYPSQREGLGEGAALPGTPPNLSGRGLGRARPSPEPSPNRLSGQTPRLSGAHYGS